MRLKYILFIFLLIFMGCSESGKKTEQRKAYANALLEKELYPQALEVFRELTNDPGVNSTTRAGVLLRMASIYSEKMKDPENALATLIRLREFYPETEAARSASPEIVKCLEKMGRALDAQNEMNQLTELKPSGDPGAAQSVVAMVEGAAIPLSEVEKAVGKMGGTRQERQEQVRRYVMSELLYRSAIRKGYDKDEKMQASMETVRKSFLANRILEEELGGILPDTAYAREYFIAHRSQYGDTTAGKVQFEEVRDRVLSDMASQKQSEAYNRLMERLLQANEVKIYMDRVP